MNANSRYVSNAAAHKIANFKIMLVMASSIWKAAVSTRRITNSQSLRDIAIGVG